jgi:enoyl-CoA hydratase
MLSADAFFCIQEINIGMVADVGTLQRLPKLIPMAVVKELAYTGRRLSADKALQYGLVNDVLPDASAALAAAMKAAKRLPANRRWQFGAPSKRCITRETTAWKIH